MSKKEMREAKRNQLNVSEVIGTYNNSDMVLANIGDENLVKITSSEFIELRTHQRNN